MQKLHWIVYLLLFAITAAVFTCFGRWTKKSTTNIVTIGGKPFPIAMRDMSKPKFPYLILTTSKEGKVDSFTIYENTPFGEIPVISETRYFPVLVFLNDKDESYEGDISIWHQGIIDSIVVNIPEKRLTTEESIKGSFNYFARLHVWIDQGKHLSADVNGGIFYKKRIGLEAKIEADHEYNVKLKAGLSVGI